MSGPAPFPPIANLSQPLPWLLTSGQPTLEQLEEAGRMGIRTVIDIRDPMEPRPFDEPEAVHQLRIRYENIPVVTGSTTDEDMARVLATLESSAGTLTLLHCSSANRTCGPLIAWLMLKEGFSEQQAVDVAMRSGLRSVEVMEFAVDFARRHQPS